MQRITRTKLKKFYHELESFQIIVLSAPKGYGKRTFILQYFYDNPNTSYICYDANTEALQIDFHAKTDYIILNEPDLSQDCTLLENVMEAVKCHATLHVVIISSKRLPDRIHEWRCENIASIIRTRSFYFDDHELLELLKANSFHTDGETVDRIQNLCGGWILAIVLFLNGYAEEDGRFLLNHEMLRMIDIYVYQPLSDEMKNQFMRLSILRDFKYDEIWMQFEEKNSFHILTHMLESCFLLRYDPKRDTYSFSDAFRIFLNEKLATSSYNSRRLHKQIGKHYAKKGNYHALLYHYYHAEEYEKICSFLNEYTGISLSQEDPHLMERIYRALPDSFMFVYPYAFLRMIQDYILLLQDPYIGERKLHMFLSNMEMQICAAQREKIMGEAQVCYGFLQYDLLHMFAYFEKATAYLKGSASRLAYSGMLVPNGCISVLFLYHTNEGDMKQMIRLVDMKFTVYAKLCNHGDAGFKELIQAEYYLETGLYQKSKLYVWEAHHTACRYKQMSVIVASLMTLGRLSFITSDSKTVKFVMKQLEHLYSTTKNPQLEKGITYCILYLRCLQNEVMDTPEWIKKAENQYTQSLYKYIVIGQMLINQQNFIELKAVGKILKKVWKSHVFARIYGELYETIAVLFTEGYENARQCYQELMVACEKDQIITPIMEKASLLKPIISCGGQQGFALTVQQAYEKIFRTNLLFTERECDILQYMSKGYSVVKTAELMKLKRDTVYTYLKHIYRKLEINCRDELIEYINTYVKIK